MLILMMIFVFIAAYVVGFLLTYVYWPNKWVPGNTTSDQQFILILSGIFWPISPIIALCVVGVMHLIWHITRTRAFLIHRRDVVADLRAKQKAKTLCDILNDIDKPNVSIKILKKEYHKYCIANMLPPDSTQTIQSWTHAIDYNGKLSKSELADLLELHKELL